MTFTVQSEAGQHDAFAEALREKGVRVHYFGQLLGETLELPEGRAFVLDRAGARPGRGALHDLPDRTRGV